VRSWFASSASSPRRADGVAHVLADAEHLLGARADQEPERLLAKPGDRAEAIDGLLGGRELALDAQEVGARDLLRLRHRADLVERRADLAELVRRDDELEPRADPLVVREPRVGAGVELGLALGDARRALAVARGVDQVRQAQEVVGQRDDELGLGLVLVEDLRHHEAGAERRHPAAGERREIRLLLVGEPGVRQRVADLREPLELRRVELGDRRLDLGGLAPHRGRRARGARGRPRAARPGGRPRRG
jgi:hypothetical protein